MREILAKLPVHEVKPGRYNFISARACVCSDVMDAADLTPGSSSLTALLAFAQSWVMRPAYCTVSSCFSVVRMGMPSWFTITTP